MIDTSKWKEFHMNKLFEISAGKYYYSDEYEQGETPYISASATNNGISQRINLEPDFKGNVIITGKVGCTAFYQIENFCATSDVNVFKPKNFEMTFKIGMFITSVLNFSENYKWSYGRQCRIGDSKKIIIKLPIEFESTGNPKIDKKKIFSIEGYIPNWKFMEEYIEKIKNSKINNKISIRESIIMKNRNLKKNFKFNTQNWKKFKLKELFDKIYKAKSHVKSELSYSDFFRKGLIPFITRTENNNGNDCYISREEVAEIEAGNAIIIGDTTSTIFYQKDSFATGDHIIVCRAKWINEYTALFFKTVLEKERYKYSYGRAFKMELVKNTVIKLPVDKNGKLDINFMESYIKSLPYGDKLERII